MLLKDSDRKSCGGLPDGQRAGMASDRDGLPSKPPKILDNSGPSGGAGPLQKFLELLEEVGARSLGLTLQHHPVLLRGASAFGLVAGQAAAHQVLPGGGSTLAKRDHMIHGGGLLLATFVLAEEMVTAEDSPFQTSQEQFGITAGLDVGEDDQFQPFLQVHVALEGRGVQDVSPA